MLRGSEKASLNPPQEAKNFNQVLEIFTDFKMRKIEAGECVCVLEENSRK